MPQLKKHGGRRLPPPTPPRCRAPAPATSPATAHAASRSVDRRAGRRGHLHSHRHRLHPALLCGGREGERALAGWLASWAVGCGAGNAPADGQMDGRAQAPVGRCAASPLPPSDPGACLLSRTPRSSPATPSPSSRAWCPGLPRCSSPLSPSTCSSFTTSSASGGASSRARLKATARCGHCACRLCGMPANACLWWLTVKQGNTKKGGREWRRWWSTRLPCAGLPRQLAPLSHCCAVQAAARSYRWSILLLALSATLREGIESVLFLTGVSQVSCCHRGMACGLE